MIYDHDNDNTIMIMINDNTNDNTIIAMINQPKTYCFGINGNAFHSSSVYIARITDMNKLNMSVENIMLHLFFQTRRCSILFFIYSILLGKGDALFYLLRSCSSL